MKDIQKIKEFFSKPIDEDFGQALFNRLKPKDSDLESIVNTLKQDLKIANAPDQASFKEALERYIRFNGDRDPIGQAAVRALNYRNTGDRYGSGFDRIFNMLVDKKNLSEAKEEDKVDTITMDVPLFIRMLEYSREDAAEDMDLHDVTEKAISLGKERGILQMDDYDEIIGAAEKINETRFSKPTGSPYEQKDLYAQELFGTEYFNWLDFWEQFHIVQKYELDKSIITKEGKEVNLKASKLSSAEYQKAKKLKDFKASDWKWNASEDLYTKVVKEGMGDQLDEPYFIEVSVRDARVAMEMFNDRYRRSNIKMYGSNVYAANNPEDIYNLYSDFQNQDIEVLEYNVDGDLDEATDYMKRRKAMDDYAVSKKDKPAKPYNPNPSGKTDYMKRREKDLSERINEAFDKINEELCPAGKAYRKRRIAAGEKSSAYLSGRAVKVCKGQMSGKKKKK